MAVDATSFGTILTLVASKTFPFGFPVMTFPDDVDPLEFPSIQIADGAMGANGDLVTWSKATYIPMTVSLLPNSFDEISMGILFQANRVAQGKSSVQDSITATVVYPNFRMITLSLGRIMEGPSGLAIASGGGRIKTRSFRFIFESMVFV